MNIALAAATFALVIPAELPDKTFLATIVLSARHRPRPVFFGVFAGLLVQAAIAVVVGQLLSLAPHRVVDAVVAAAFFGGAAYLAFGKESKAAQHGTEIAEHEDEIVGARGTIVAKSTTSIWIATTTFIVVVLAEFGDLTQILIANLAARSDDATSVFVGAAAAFALTSALGVIVGRTVIRVVPLTVVRRISALILFGLGIWSLVSAARG